MHSKDLSKRERFSAAYARYIEKAGAGDWHAAFSLANEMMKGFPEQPVAHKAVGMSAMRLGHLAIAESAYLNGMEILSNEDNDFDFLSELYGHMVEAAKRAHETVDRIAELRDNSRRFGLKALSRHDAVSSDAPLWHVPSFAPPSLSPNRARNVIAITLFGSSPSYCEMAVINVNVAKKLLPQWTVRIYLDQSVPVDVHRRLHDAGADIVHCDGAAWQGIHPLMRRFAVMEDDMVDRWLIRDADSLLSTREVAAINEWLATPFWFHMMRDYFTHTELLLAGLLGGCGGVFTELLERMRSYCSSYKGDMRVIDQHFLRKIAWPTIKPSLLTHDSWFGFLGARGFPAHDHAGWADDCHVGAGLTNATVQSAVNTVPDGAMVEWRIFDEKGDQVCSYSSPVVNGMWQVRLPNVYAAKLSTKEWRIDARHENT